MIGIVIWLFFVIVGYLVLYGTIKAAINGSELSGLNGELRTNSSQSNRYHDDLNKHMEELKQLIREQNQILRDLKPSSSRDSE